MPCPRCGSTDLWDDNFWSGCNKCDWMHSCEREVLQLAPAYQPIRQDPGRSDYCTYSDENRLFDSD